MFGKLNTVRYVDTEDSGASRRRIRERAGPGRTKRRHREPADAAAAPARAGDRVLYAGRLRPGRIAFR
ncbi:hypothetical protein EVAR_15701_1 [Eumeta japonica]|uniref:Uncharacterized protein n=1 Tax=Eumeta variegata TaxID=151549 RepID=A0A4C1UAD4_EUMVA|nr:hypothetical protein EVAR_15701_1 [Eumeta japonica]